MRRQAAAALLAFVGASVAVARAATEPSPPRVVVRDGKVTARLEQAPLAAALAAIAQETGAEVRGEVLNPRPVTLELDAVPLEDALERLLDPQSFTLTYRSDGGLKRVILGRESVRGPRPSPGAAPGAAGAAPAASPEVQEATRRIADYVQGNRTVPVSGHLAEALGTDTATFQQVLGTAFKHEDPRVRAESRRAMVKALAADPEVRSALAVAASGMADETLVTALRNVGGPDAEELAMAFARYGRSPALSRRMQRAVSELRRKADGS